MEEKLGTGADHSIQDNRTISHSDLATATPELFVSGGYEYTINEVEHQHMVGICTAISLIQNREKANGKKYSPEFQYLLQKTLYDMNWVEGSSIFNALKVGKSIGFLPAESWIHTTEQDRYLPYDQYIAKLQAIPSAEIERLKSLCIDKIAGYASVDVSDPQSIARAIVASESGILCRYGCQKNWWTPSWLARDIDPLRNGIETSGHAINMCSFDYSKGSNMQMLANTWGVTWCLNGSAHINWDNYKMTEAWIILKSNPLFKFNTDMHFGQMNSDIRELQKRLGVIQTGFFGLLTKNAVMLFQSANHLSIDGVVGPLTRAALNK